MEAPAQIAPGREVRLLEPADEWFVVLSIDGDLLHLARRHEGNLTAGFWIDTHAVRGAARARHPARTTLSPG